MFDGHRVFFFFSLSLSLSLSQGCSTEETERRDRNHSWPRKRFLYHIVNNKESGLDVDKLDYYRRDCRYSGISIRDVYDNLIDSSRVMICDDDGVQRICYPEKYAEDVYVEKSANL